MFTFAFQLSFLSEKCVMLVPSIPDSAVLSCAVNLSSIIGLNFSYMLVKGLLNYKAAVSIRTLVKLDNFFIIFSVDSLYHF